MGSPMVFQTAPPHPASNARITWSPQLAGGPDASQNGLGHRMPPAKLVVRSAIVRLLTILGYFTWATALIYTSQHITHLEGHMTGLLGSTVLEVAIGVVFVYLLLAVFCTTINEWLAGVFKTRGALLKQGILQLLAPDAADDKAASKDPVVAEFYGHPLIKSLMRGGNNPSYLSARAFATVIMDLATPNQQG